MHPVVQQVTDRIQRRSQASRLAYLQHLDAQRSHAPTRKHLHCGNLAHGFAACSAQDKDVLKLMNQANVGIVTAYNDMLSAHQPYAAYPDIIRAAAREMGCVAQVAGGVPAMCDGVTQGQPGMELSLFSRDTIAMSTAIALSHQMFDSVLLLGICDKIVPGLLIGALAFGHLPALLVPAGPMASGLPNKEKQRIRQLYAEGKVDQAALLDSESRSYHSAGTCTFYGTANSNQLLVEVMGLHLPGAAFFNPDDPVREPLTREAVWQSIRLSAPNGGTLGLGQMVDEKSIVNALVALLCTGGSTNHTLHWIAIARAAGIQINWDDFNDLSAAVPLLTRMYPNGQDDVNAFHAAGGTPFLIRTLLDAGLLHEDVETVVGRGLSRYARMPSLRQGKLGWNESVTTSANTAVLRGCDQPFSADGGLRVLQGNLGRGVIKVSAVDPTHWVVEAPAKVFNDQDELAAAFERGELNQDCVAVVRFQGPRANGMPELHKLTPYLGVLQDKGYKVALVTDGRMSGASGKVPAAIHVYPEAALGGPLARLRDGDRVRLDATTGSIDVLIGQAEWDTRMPIDPDIARYQCGTGRELFTNMRRWVSEPEAGASFLWPEAEA
jgi:phosphogluconate dehydratase